MMSALARLTSFASERFCTSPPRSSPHVPADPFAGTAEDDDALLKHHVFARKLALLQASSVRLSSPAAG